MIAGAAKVAPAPDPAAAMARALRRVDPLDNASRRAAAYLAADVAPEDINRFDARAIALEATRRELFPDE